MQPDPDALARIGRRGAARDAYLNMLAHADERGVVILRGGVRGWSELFGCSPSYPRQALATLAAEEIAEVAYLGDGLAEVRLLRSISDRSPPALQSGEGSITDRTPATPVAPLVSEDTASECRERSISDRSPPAPPIRNNIQMCGGGGGGAVLSAQQEGLPDPTAQLLIKLGVAPETAHEIAPAATPDQIAYLVRGAERRGADIPAWVVAGVRAGRRPPPHTRAPEQPVDPIPRAEFRRQRDAAAAPPPAPPEADPPGDADADGDAEIAESPLPEPERGDWRRRFWSATPSERPGVLGAFRIAVSKADQGAQAPPGAAPEPEPGPALDQTWQAALLELQRQLSKPEFDTWYRHTRLVELDAGQATVSAPTALAAERLGQSSLVRRVLSDVLGTLVRVRVVAGGAL